MNLSLIAPLVMLIKILFPPPPVTQTLYNNFVVDLIIDCTSFNTFVITLVVTTNLSGGRFMSSGPAADSCYGIHNLKRVVG